MIVVIAGAITTITLKVFYSNQLSLVKLRKNQNMLKKSLPIITVIIISHLILFSQVTTIATMKIFIQCDYDYLNNLMVNMSITAMTTDRIKNDYQCIEVLDYYYYYYDLQDIDWYY